MDGRVKTLHPKLYGGILSKRNNTKHQNELLKNKYDEIDLVIVNFYPFEETLKKSKNHKAHVFSESNHWFPAGPGRSAKKKRFCSALYMELGGLT